MSWSHLVVGALLLGSAARAEPATPPELPWARWVLPVEAVGLHASRRAWLELAHREVLPGPLRVSLPKEEGFATWFGSSDECGPLKGATTAEVAPDSARLLPVCFRLEQDQKSHLVAVVERDGDPATDRAFESGAIAVTETPPWPPEVMALVSAAFGLVGGALLAFVTKQIELRSSRHDERVKVTRSVLEHLLPELRRNLATLDALVQAKRLPDKAADLLSVGGFESLRKDSGFMTFLDEAERERFLSPFSDVYRHVSEFNRVVRVSPPDAQNLVTALREQIRSQIER